MVKSAKVSNPERGNPVMGVPRGGKVAKAEVIAMKGLLQRIPIFSGLNNKEFERLATGMKRQVSKKGAFLFYENDEGHEMYLIVSGLVKVFKSDAAGHIKTLTFLRDGDFFGEMALLDVEARSASAQFMEDTDLMVLDGRSFRGIVDDYPILALKMLKTMSMRLREANRQIEDLAFRNLPGRVASTILRLADKHGADTADGRLITVELTHQELADLVGTAREVITSILNAFRKAGCVSVEKHRITILNREELASWLV